MPINHRPESAIAPLTNRVAWALKQMVRALARMAISFDAIEERA
jgi:hypothetical protein